MSPGGTKQVCNLRWLKKHSIKTRKISQKTQVHHALLLPQLGGRFGGVRCLQQGKPWKRAAVDYGGQATHQPAPCRLSVGWHEGESWKFTTDAHHSPTLIEGNCPLSLLARLVTMRLYRNEAIQWCYTGIPLFYGDHTEHLNINKSDQIFWELRLFIRPSCPKDLIILSCWAAIGIPTQSVTSIVRPGPVFDRGRVFPIILARQEP